MACRERELLTALRALVAAEGGDNESELAAARILLTEIDDEARVIEHERNPYGDYDGRDG